MISSSIVGGNNTFLHKIKISWRKQKSVAGQNN